MDNERALVEEFAQKLNTQMIYFIPRDNVVQHAVLQRKAMIEYAPESAQAEEYRTLAKTIDSNTAFSVPTPISNDELEDLLLRYVPVGG
ncbi:MAG: hypothetical protein LUG17_03195 [Clostridiales bacterium]|nr:hypothetical protein [Clostridiales bacterium]